MITTLQNQQSTFSQTISDAIAQQGIANSFNPSIGYFHDSIYVAFRGQAKGKGKPFDAFLLVIDRQASHQLINLSDKATAFGIEPVADPKLVTLNNELWMTFNTGWDEGNNKIYLWKIAPTLEKPLECLYKDRQAVEKNWGFFSENNQIMCLYDVSKGLILQATDQPLSDDTIEFTTLSQIRSNSQLQSFTLGTQPLKINGAYYLIAHKKISLFKKRLYLGRLVSFTFNNQSIKKLEVSKRLLAHSFKSLFGSPIKHNKNLISCTYFSGMLNHEDSILLSYGINDVDFNIVELSKESL
ncbi:MAG: hypothetical protein OXE99_14905 [Cellvibrionales bacterium]|nr:hypothetical protein [Cellvibrionales bacterium]